MREHVTYPSSKKWKEGAKFRSPGSVSNPGKFFDAQGDEAARITFISSEQGVQSNSLPGACTVFRLLSLITICTHFCDA